MNAEIINDRDLITMKLLYYFIKIKNYNPVIVQKGYKSKEEGEKDLEQFKKWAWTEVEYTDVEQQCYALYPTEIIEEMGLDYKEKDVPEGEPPEFKANPYYRTNYWGD